MGILVDVKRSVFHVCIYIQPPPIQPSDNQLSLADFDAIKVIGKGSSGIVRLVQHKWTGQFFALKVLYRPTLCLSSGYYFIPLNKKDGEIKPCI